MRVLVTGAAGFIGQHVCRELKQRGHFVVGLDERAPPNPQVVTGWIFTNIAHSILQRPLTKDLDAVIHLAGIANPRECDADPARAYEVNVHGTHNVLEMARRSGAKKVVFASSAHVYGIPADHLPTGEDSALYPQSVYTVTKILGEDLCRLYWHTYRIPYTILRLFNTYGPGQAKGFFVPDMVAKAQQGKIELKGANTTKDFVYVEDVARAFVQALDMKYPAIFNIGSGEEILLGHMASMIANRLSVPLEAYHAGEGASRMLADISFAKAHLKWEPKVSLSEGLDAVCASQIPVP